MKNHINVLVASVSAVLFVTLFGGCKTTNPVINSNQADIYCTYKSTCNGNITDTRDNKNHKTVQIGTQCWMAQNLNVGNQIPGYQQQDSGTDNQNNSIEKYCYGDNTTNSCITYGGLYLWDEMMAYNTSRTNSPGPRGICPTGWHLPTDNEWKCLEMTLGDAATAGGKLKDTTLWNSPNTGATNSNGFKALPSGLRDDGGRFGSLGAAAPSFGRLPRAVRRTRGAATWATAVRGWPATTTPRSTTGLVFAV